MTLREIVKTGSATRKHYNVSQPTFSSNYFPMPTTQKTPGRGQYVPVGVTNMTSRKTAIVDVATITLDKKSITISDMGWTREQAIAIRGLFSFVAEDWDDPEMDIYNVL